jgi:hypothetical protein
LLWDYVIISLSIKSTLTWNSPTCYTIYMAVATNMEFSTFEAKVNIIYFGSREMQEL